MTESLRWAKSSYSNNGGACIEWAPEHAAATGEFLVRDSKDPHGPALAFPAQQWSHFVEYAKAQSI
ncbi:MULTISPECIES: DUF397 domain-containing protein [Streptomyces]|uniref:DUF397 domain-containing protein n=1 Tax=Streptomyces TaxID=1883 RepID=UPI0020C095A6|nr:MULTISPECIES: DUF397 domain-containing protein [Streptomyces]MCL6301952.1 DUF397 domain-containing protein [Streptomyces kronopolitis]GLW16646.1 hypothetical protein Stsp01_33890 [Streptomyces sp. NBRC 13847]